MTLLAGSLDELAETLSQKAAEKLDSEVLLAGVMPDYLVVVTLDGDVKSLPWEYADDELVLGEAKVLEGDSAQEAILAAAEKAGGMREEAPDGFERETVNGNFVKIRSGLEPAEAKALELGGDDVEEKGAYVEIPGSWEATLSELRDSVSDLLSPPPPAAADGTQAPERVSRPWVSVVATFDDRVLARMTQYNGEADDTTYWTVPWSMDDDGEAVLGVPVAVELTASVTPLSTPLEADDPTPPASAMNGSAGASGGGGVSGLGTALSLLGGGKAMPPFPLAGTKAFEEGKHPRDKHGMFAHVGDTVKTSDGKTGKIIGTASDGDLRVKTGDGPSEKVKSSSVEVTHDSDGAKLHAKPAHSTVQSERVSGMKKGDKLYAATGEFMGTFESGDPKGKNGATGIPIMYTPKSGGPPKKAFSGMMRTQSEHDRLDKTDAGKITGAGAQPPKPKS